MDQFIVTAPLDALETMQEYLPERARGWKLGRRPKQGAESKLRVAPMIRLGSLAGYQFEGPVLLGEWEPPEVPGVFAVMYRTDPEAAHYAVVYVGHSDNLEAEGFPFGHPQASCWAQMAGAKEALLIAWSMVPGTTRSIRNGIANELNTIYQPICSEETYDLGWTPPWWDDPPGPGGSGGVREPLRPRPSPIAGAAAAEPDN